MKRQNIDKARQLRKSQTDAERKLWTLLRNRQAAGVKFRRQFPFEQYILDFYSPEVRICIECDGGQHFEKDRQAFDDARTKRLLDFGVRVIRFNNRDVLMHLEVVGEAICQAIKEAENSPLTSVLSPGGEDSAGKS